MTDQKQDKIDGTVPQPQSKRWWSGIQGKRRLGLPEPEQKSLIPEMWTCKKCGLLRSNKFTHRHGVSLTKDQLKNIEESGKDEKTEAVQP